MSFRKQLDGVEGNPLLIWGQRFMVVALTLACLLTLMADRLFPAQIAPIKTQTSDLFAPIVAVAEGPVLWGKARLRGWNAYLDAAAQAENARRIAQENEALRENLRRKDRELAELRANISMPPEGIEAFRTARVIMEGGSLFSSSLILGVGTRDSALLFDRAYLSQFVETNPETGQVFLPRDPCLGADVGDPPPYCLLAPIKPNLAVVTRQGILGRLSSVGHNAARVRLLTDRDSELPVLIGDFQVKGLVRGTGRALLTLTTAEAIPGSIRVGDAVTTSNIDPDIPYLFLVGEVVELEPEILVRPAAIPAQGLPEFVQVVIKEPLDAGRNASGDAGDEAAQP